MLTKPKAIQRTRIKVEPQVERRDLRGGRDEEAPSSKLQAPKKSQAPSPTATAAFCCLALGISLELGAWSLRIFITILQRSAFGWCGTTNPAARSARSAPACQRRPRRVGCGRGPPSADWCCPATCPRYPASCCHRNRRSPGFGHSP